MVASVSIFQHDPSFKFPPHSQKKLFNFYFSFELFQSFFFWLKGLGEKVFFSQDLD